MVNEPQESTSDATESTGRISLRGVSKRFVRLSRGGRLHSLKGALLHGQLLGRGHEGSDSSFTAVDGLDLEVMPGEAVALIGRNGSGKTTTLKLVSGILRPTDGEVEVNGRVTALIELGAGFHPEITGRENVIINGMLLGLSRAEVEARLDEIVRFSGLSGFIEQPVKTYSSGMYVRLGFAVAVAAEPDVLLIDEVLAVGDAEFTRRGLDRLARMRRRGVTMLIVSHDLELVMQIADRAVYLDEGRMVMDGDADAVVARYRSDVERGSLPEGHERVEVSAGGDRWGTGDVRITSVDFLCNGRVQGIVPSGAECAVRIRYEAVTAVQDFVFGVAWHRADGVQVAGHNTHLDGLTGVELSGSGEVQCLYPSLQFAPGELFVDVAIHAVGGLAYDYWCRALRVRVTAPVEWPGVVAPEHHWEGRGPRWRESSASS